MKTEGKTPAMPPGELRMVAPDALVPAPWQRRRIDAKAPTFRELVESVRVHGVLVPLHARPTEGMNHKLQVLVGHRRREAALRAGLAEIPVLVHEGCPDDVAQEFTFIENFNREDLTPFEESEAVAGLLELHGGDAKAVAAKLGRTERWVRLRARLQKLADCWRVLLAADPESADYEGPDVDIRRWGAGHLELVARLPETVQVEMLEGLPVCYGHEDWTVDDLQDYTMRELLYQLKAAPWDLADAGLDADAGACATCPKRSSQSPGLFEDVQESASDDRCLDHACWERKQLVWLKRAAEAAEAKHGELAGVIGDAASRYYAERNPKPVAKKLKRKNLRAYYDYDATAKVTARTPGAKPALVVSGKDLGEVRWVVPVERGGSGSHGVTQKPEDPAKAAARQRREKRERWLLAEVKRRARRMLRNLKVLPERLGDPEARLALALACSDMWEFDRRWKRYGALRGAALTQAFWKTVHKAINQLKDYRRPKANAKAAAAALGIDFASLEKEARKKFAAPKPKRTKKAKSGAGKTGSKRRRKAKGGR